MSVYQAVVRELRLVTNLSKQRQKFMMSRNFSYAPQMGQRPGKKHQTRAIDYPQVYLLAYAFVVFGFIECVLTPSDEKYRDIFERIDT